MSMHNQNPHPMPTEPKTEALPSHDQMQLAMAIVRYLQGRCISDEELTKISTLDIANVIARRTPTPAVGDGWQPIETAPKDGTRVLFYDPDSSGLIYAGVWDAKFCSEWPEGAEEAVYRGAWTDYAVASFAYEEHCEYSPTHWQPLPTPPAIRTGGPGK